MPVKNAEKWLIDTIDSIVSQTYTNWELICIDDHSTDRSRELILTYLKNDSRIQLERNTSSGIIPALQQALKYASGTFITRMDADDIMPTARLQQMVEALNSSPNKTVITGKVKYISEEAVSPGYLKYQNWINARVDHNDFYQHIYRECVVASPNWIVRKDDMLKDQIFEQLLYPEDYDMTFHWLKHDYQIKGISEITLLWREHTERTSRNSSVYDQASFFRLKLGWFTQLNDLKKRSIAILGAGQKGKQTAQFLKDAGTDFSWHDFHFNKYNSPIHGKRIQNYEDINADLLLICIYPDRLDELEVFLHSKGFEIGQNAWFL